MQETAAKLRKEDREVGRGRKWRQNYRLLNQEVLLLEEEEKKLELVYPQVGLGTLMCFTIIQKLLSAFPTMRLQNYLACCTLLVSKGLVNLCVYRT